MPKRYNSDAFEAIHESMSALHKIGAIDDAEMREFDAKCLQLSPAQPPHERRAGETAFAVFKDARGHWRWRLTGPDGKALAISPVGFDTRRACLGAIDTMRHLQDTAVKG